MAYVLRYWTRLYNTVSQGKLLDDNDVRQESDEMIRKLEEQLQLWKYQIDVGDDVAFHHSQDRTTIMRRSPTR